VSESSSSGGGSGCGCFTLIALVIVLWALIFGVTWNGQHHGISCSCDKGLVVK
jgi:hypothetical protein